MTVIGLPTETKDKERRVALDPIAVAGLRGAGHAVHVQAGAGLGAGFTDADYKEAGADVVPDAEDAWAAELVVKVKEPQRAEFRFFRPDLTLFAFLHLAAEPELTRALVDSGCTAHAFETVTDRSGGLPLLAPMSEIAGRAAAIIGAYHLAAHTGGSGTLLGGAAGTLPARVMVLGLGVAGSMAARGARGLDAEVTGVDVDLDRLRRSHADGTVTSTLASSPAAVGELVEHADLVIGAALVPGARAPLVVTAEHVARMRPGSVIVDLAIDQGGCVETARPTTLSDPTYIVDGVLHYCVTNVPGQFPRTASRALSAAIAPYTARLAGDPRGDGLDGACNVRAGEVAHPAVVQALGFST
jgi:alanine dehydrogenase